MNEAMLAAVRELGVKAVLTLPTGTVRELDGDDVLSFSVEEGAQGALLPGSVLSARLTLELKNDSGQWRNVPLVGATAQVYVLCGSEELCCGVFIIDSVSAQERGGAVKLGGSDSIASELAVQFVDDLIYPATLRQVWEKWLAQTRYVWSGVLPGGSVEIPNAPDWGEVTLRKAAGWIAQAAGCFVRVNRLGALELVSCAGGESGALGPEAYWDLDDGFHSWGPVAAVQVKNREESFIVSEGAGETVLVDGNPLMQTGEIARSMLAQVKGLTLEKAGFRWRGDPSVSVGSRIALTDTYGSEKLCTVTRQTMAFDRGFSAQVVCSVPDSGDGGIVRAITPEGGVNAGALVGTVDGGLLAAESVAAQSIAAKAITAEKLAAGAVTADKLDANTVSAQAARFVAAEMQKLTAGEIATDELYAAFGHFLELSAASLRAGKAEIDVLASALANFVSLHAATGEFDFAAIQNLVSNAMSLAQGAMETVYIKNLAVTDANLLSATLGKLVIKGEDGKYYRVFVGSDGMISTEEVSEGALDEEIEGGRQIVETSMNVGSLNATNLQASGAVINSILTTALTAEKITAADALIASATIPALYATTIEAIGNSLELLASSASRAFRGETAPADAKPGDLWIQPSTGYTYQMAADGLPELYFSDPDIYYAYAEGLMQYALAMDASGDLYVDSGIPCTLAVATDGALTAWQRVKDSELDKTAQDALEKSEENAALIVEHESSINLMQDQIKLRVESSTFDEVTGELQSGISMVDQRAESIEISLEKKVDGDELRTYIRYEDGIVEIGRSDSRYTTQTSDAGFMVLQDGAEMASMTKNTVAAPVVEAKRQFVLGGYVIRLGTDGGLIFL